MTSINLFQHESPSVESYWRSIVLFGRNTASYKFALAQSLLELSQKGVTGISLEELATPYATQLCQHLLVHPRQTTGETPPFIQSCLQFNSNEITKEELLSMTIKHGFRYVLDAFHVVNGEALPCRFFEKDFTRQRKRITFTDEVLKLAASPACPNLLCETEARWKLVETAWENGLNPALLGIKYDEGENLLFVDNYLQRKNITSAKDALNGYQKGKCFYCFRDIDIDAQSPNACDVDHFYPHILKPYMPEINLDGVWNLVLACKHCNRGADGKFAKAPALRYVQRLHKRNEFLICSHHPLRETLMQQMGNAVVKRLDFIRSVDRKVSSYLLHRWETGTINPPLF